MGDVERARREHAERYGERAAEKLFGKAKPKPAEVAGTTAGPLVTPEARKDKPKAPPQPVKPPPNAKPTGLAPTGAEDMIAPGQGQQAFDWYGGAFFEPTTGQNLWGDIGKGFEAPGISERVGGDLAEGLAKKGTQGDTYGVDYVQGLQGSGAMKMPGMVDEAWKNVKALEADVGGYYDNAFTDAQRKLNRSQAARGRLNSSDSIRAAGEQANKFAGERAKAEGDFRMQRAQAMNELAVQGTGAKRDWLTGMGDLAFKAGTEQREYADTASQIATRAQDSETARMESAFNAAFGVDNASTDRLMSGMEAAFGAQDLHDNRFYKGLEAEILLGDKAVDVYGEKGAGGADADSANAGISTGVAAAEDARRAEEAESQAANQAMVDSLALAAETGGKIAGSRGGSAGGVRTTMSPDYPSSQNPYQPNMSGGPARRQP